LKVNPQTFFAFCAGHVALLRHLSARPGELAEGEVTRLIRTHAAEHDELPDTTWRRLLELQILVPAEPGSTQLLVAEPVSRLLTYLFDEANPATPEMIRGYISSLEVLTRQLDRAIDQEDLTGVGLAFQEVGSTLRRIHADLEETQRSIQSEVAAFKTARAHITVREKFRRIVYWMERYVEPMIDIVRADGPLRAVFEGIERGLARAREESLFNDHPALERNQRFLRLLRARALRIFDQSRREIEPLYQSLRRSSFIAEGAARALTQLQQEGLDRWDAQSMVPVFALRWLHVPGDEAIALALRRVIESPPEPAPVLDRTASTETPAALLRRLWLNALVDQVRPALPVDDLLGWLTARHPERTLAEIVSGFTALLFHRDFRGRFLAVAAHNYATPDGTLRAHPLRLESA
jgi:hypothetical protein